MKRSARRRSGTRFWSRLRGQAGSDDNILNRPLDSGLGLEDLMASVARHYLQRALEQTKGNKTQAAALLGFRNYQTLTNWMEKYEVERWNN